MALSETLENRRLFSGSGEQTFGIGAESTTATLTDNDGTVISLTLAGPGTGTASTDDAGRLHLSLRDTTGSSSLTLKTVGGDGLATLAGVEIDGSLRALTAKTADLQGDLSATGAIRTVWINSAPGDDTISAATLGDLRLTGNLAADVRVPTGRIGSINVGGSASSLTVRASRIDRIDVRGDLGDAKILVLPSADFPGTIGLGRLSIRGTVRDTTVHAMANIGSVSASAMFDSFVVAGVRYEEAAPAAGVFEPVLPEERSSVKEFDFTGKYALGTLSVTGAVRDAGNFAFGNSRIAAYRIGSVKLAGVQPENEGRAFGVAGYYVNRVQRRFGGAGGDTINVKPPLRAGRFSVHQIYEPLTYDPTTGTYSGAAGSMTITGITSGGSISLPQTIALPSEGIEIGTVTNHPLAATVRLAADGAYIAIDVPGNVVARQASVAALAVELVGTPGTSMKIVQVPELRGNSSGQVLRPASLKFLSTSVSPEMTIQAAKPNTFYRSAAGTEYRLSTLEEIQTSFATLGVAAQTYETDLLKLQNETLLVGRRFNIEKGASEITLTPALGLEVAGESELFTEIAAALVGDAQRLGSGRFPIRVRYFSTGISVSGLADGGTAVLYTNSLSAINAIGDTLDFPSSAKLSERLAALGLWVTHHNPY